MDDKRKVEIAVEELGEISRLVMAIHENSNVLHKDRITTCDCNAAVAWRKIASLYSTMNRRTL